MLYITYIYIYIYIYTYIYITYIYDIGLLYFASLYSSKYCILIFRQKVVFAKN